MKIRSFAFVVKIFLILSVITNASGRMDYHSELKNKYNTFIKERSWNGNKINIFFFRRNINWW
mgnify:CR=1 FL=1